MRHIRQTLIGGLLAGTLVLSALPAYALEESPGAGEAVTEEQEAPQAPESGEAETPNADAPSGEVAVVEEVEPVEGPDEFADVPDDVAVNGTLFYIAQEHPHDESGEAEHDAEEAPEGFGGFAFIATEEGPLLPVDPASFSGDVTPGQQFAGTVELPQQAEAEVRSEIEDGGVVAAAEVLEIVAGVANDSGESLTITGAAQAPDLTAGAVTAKSHSADIVWFNNTNLGRNITTYPPLLDTMVTATGTYWKTQTDSKISSLSKSSVKRINKSWATSSTSYCNQTSLWNEAAASYGKKVADYKGGKHLIVFVDSTCTPGLTGLASVGSIHGGGTIWVNLSYVNGGNPNNILSVLAHEFGHNLGLGHSQARVCTSPAVDSSTALGYDPQSWVAGWGYTLKIYKPASPCADREYADRWSVMGNQHIAKPTALNAGQKYELGVLPSGAAKSVTSSGGATQTFTLTDAGQNTNAAANPRMLRVTNPAGGYVYVEYRGNAGQDSGSGISGTPTALDGHPFRVSTGLVVSKVYPTASQLWSDGKWRSFKYPRSSALGHWEGGYQQLALQNADAITPLGNKVRVTATGSTGQVKVDFLGFTNGSRSVSIANTNGTPLYPGKSLKANLSGTWGMTFGTPPSTITDKYQWLRNGTAISGATKATYKLTTADAGKTISVRVKPSASGYATAPGVTANAAAVNALPFSDVAWNHAFFNEIKWMKDAGVSTGSGGKYLPNNPVTREQMSAFIYRMKGSPSFTPPATSPFKDVKKTNEFYKPITWMLNQNITTGQGSGANRVFLPKSNVTREQMATFLYRAAGSPAYTPPATSPFKDVKTSSQYYKPIAWMYAQGITTGQGSGANRVYLPTSNVTRGQMAAFLYRYTH